MEEEEETKRRNGGGSSPTKTQTRRPEKRTRAEARSGKRGSVSLVNKDGQRPTMWPGSSSVGCWKLYAWKPRHARAARTLQRCTHAWPLRVRPCSLFCKPDFPWLCLIMVVEGGSAGGPLLSDGLSVREQRPGMPLVSMAGKYNREEPSVDLSQQQLSWKENNRLQQGGRMKHASTRIRIHMYIRYVLASFLFSPNDAQCCCKGIFQQAEGGDGACFWVASRICTVCNHTHITQVIQRGTPAGLGLGQKEEPGSLPISRLPPVSSTLQLIVDVAGKAIGLPWLVGGCLCFCPVPLSASPVKGPSWLVWLFLVIQHLICSPAQPKAACVGGVRAELWTHP